MGYVSKSYLSTQFTNFATRVATVFAKKTELPTKTSDLTNDSNFAVDSSYVHTDNNFTNDYKTKVDNSVLVTAQTLTEEQKTQVKANIGVSDLDSMKFKGSLGTGGTITELPSATTKNNGFTYKVITEGTYAEQSAKVGDLFISNGSSWVLIPSGDEPSGTVTSVAVAEGDGIGVSGSPITTSGTITITNKGVRSVAEGSTNGTISVNTNGTTENVLVHGLGTLAFSNETIPTEDTGNIDFSNYFTS